MQIHYGYTQPIAPGNWLSNRKDYKWGFKISRKGQIQGKNPKGRVGWCLGGVPKKSSQIGKKPPQNRPHCFGVMPTITIGSGVSELSPKPCHPPFTPATGVQIPLGTPIRVNGRQRNWRPFFMPRIPCGTTEACAPLAHSKRPEHIEIR